VVEELVVEGFAVEATRLPRLDFLCILIRISGIPTLLIPTAIMLDSSCADLTQGLTRASIEKACYLSKRWIAGTSRSSPAMTEVSQHQRRLA
jgi:hypothetical protein